MKIAIFGLGYVGLSNAILLAQKHSVVAVDVVQQKVELVNKRISPIVDADINSFLKNKNLNLVATTDWRAALSDAELVIIATPTNYDPEIHFFDTSSVEKVIENVRSVKRDVLIIIKSTVPVGYVNDLNSKGLNKIVFVPEFLREGKALYDNLYPSRIVVGTKGKQGQWIADLFSECAKRQDIPILLTNPTEAEAIKLFANTCLALRVAFFNELDTYAWQKGLNSSDLIRGIGLDPRIGLHYCNPSFGYGGYCLPKDTKQLLADYKGVPQALIKAVVDSNDIRKQVVVDRVIQSGVASVGIYRLVMKANSDNFRSAAILDVMQGLRDHQIAVTVYEPTLTVDEWNGYPVEKDLRAFKKESALILANRFDALSLGDVADKVLTRDIFGME